jgi:hypothetical protein
MRSLPSPSPPATAGDMFERISDIENWGKLLPTPRRGAIMENKIGDDAKHAEIGIERDDEVDYVSAWIMSVAIGMIVLGAMCARSVRLLFNRSDAAGNNGKPFCDYPVNDQAAPARMSQPPSPSHARGWGDEPALTAPHRRQNVVPNGHRRPLMRFSDWNVNIPHRIIVDGNHAPLSRDDDQIRGGATRAQN